MASLVDLERIQKYFSRRGEKVVIVIPGSEPVVMVPLSEYEQANPSPVLPKPAEPKTAIIESKSQSPANKILPPPESVDPLVGGLEDDDQYFPEPL